MPETLTAHAPLGEWLRYIETVHSRSMDLTLDRVHAVLTALHLQLPGTVVSVAGTNGKGSSVAMLESIYSTAGYRVGAYTSPHLVRYNERIRLDRNVAADDELAAAFAAVDSARGQIPLTYFEFGTLAAFWIFARYGVDITILEVGLGGRQDAVNVVDADVALITSVGLDHMQWLGTTRSTIGAEKAGIMRNGRPVVCADPDPPDTIGRAAQGIGAKLWCLGAEFGNRGSGARWDWWGQAEATDGRDEYRDLPLPPFNGEVQRHNAAGVVAVVHCLQDRLPVALAALREGLQDARLAGRLQILPGLPRRILDVAHNADAVTVLAEFLKQQQGLRHTIAVAGMLADKPVTAIVQQLARSFDRWHVARLGGERGAPSTVLAAAVREVAPGVPVVEHDDPVAAYTAALSVAQPDDCVVIFGSFLTVGAIMEASAVTPISNT
ncbi:MAG: bifunctional tetrahydrofolate synthase/dihydrofolate synthase [Gammaproteobacteria bacterium]|nr:bifunctional tetrahydrofolate synthase/dihydrofolate synthase [Gammaproteobacteria bacterium]MDH3466220.1 bifunctional tetrahydrofolate synthase/dihydrofolate synthase [Gammaproteobacteria bacterium]